MNDPVTGEDIPWEEIDPVTGDVYVVTSYIDPVTGETINKDNQ